MQPSLIGHWPLSGDAQDHSGQGNHGDNRGANLDASDGARFDGRTSHILVPDSPSLQLGPDDFSISAQVYTQAQVDDPLGDILSKFCPDQRRGFSLGFKRHSAACTSLANYRNLHFGIDAGHIDDTWTDCGQLGNAIFVMALCVHQGHLYAGTCEAHGAGRVFRFDGHQWTDLGAPAPCNAVMSLAPFNGQLYAGSGRLKLLGSSLPPSSNTHEGGHVFRLQDDQWIDCGKLGGERGDYAEYCHDTVGAFEVFQSQLYAVPLYTQGLFRYDGDQQWTDCGSYGRRAFTLGAFRDQLHILDNGNQIIRYASHGDSTTWTRLAALPGVSQVYSMAVYEGKLVVGTWPQAAVFRQEDDGSWTDIGRLGDELEVMGMAVYNGKLYAGTLPLGQVYRFDGDGQWTCTGQLDTTPEVRYRRAWSTAVYRGKLYYGVLPSGKVLSLEAGKNATYDHALEPGWRHIAAVRQGGDLSLYVNGEKVGSSSAFNPTDYNLSNDKPLQIGLGQHDYFNGRLADVRLYRGALDIKEIEALSQRVE
ncbi:MAG: hypothetical protein GKR89_03545 [Candidatus Latescibacteria bacterium]|nr:hypothetical protein [Candidatus Latescibacterota bacterium]